MILNLIFLLRIIGVVLIVGSFFIKFPSSAELRFSERIRHALLLAKGEDSRYRKHFILLGLGFWATIVSAILLILDSYLNFT